MFVLRKTFGSINPSYLKKLSYIRYNSMIKYQILPLFDQQKYEKYDFPLNYFPSYYYNPILQQILQDYDVKPTKNVSLAIVKLNGMTLKYFCNYSWHLCLEAVKQNGLALQYVDSLFIEKKKCFDDDYEHLCVEAIKQNISAMQYVDYSKCYGHYNYYQKEIISKWLYNNNYK
jgi:hypothetical protein